MSFPASIGPAWFQSYAPQRRRRLDAGFCASRMCGEPPVPDAAFCASHLCVCRSQYCDHFPCVCRGRKQAHERYCADCLESDPGRPISTRPSSKQLEEEDDEAWHRRIRDTLKGTTSRVNECGTRSRRLARTDLNLTVESPPQSIQASMLCALDGHTSWTRPSRPLAGALRRSMPATSTSPTAEPYNPLPHPLTIAPANTASRRAPSETQTLVSRTTRASRRSGAQAEADMYALPPRLEAVAPFCASLRAEWVRGPSQTAAGDKTDTI